MTANMKFPEKLWTITNECKSGSIGWGTTEDTLILDYNKFQDEYLSKEKGIFKTSNIASFVRQLNLYGFRKCNRQADLHEFKNPYFVKNHRGLIINIKRKYIDNFSLDSSFRTRRNPKKIKVKKDSEKSLESYAREFLQHQDSSNPLCERQKGNENRGENIWWNSMPFAPLPSNIFSPANTVPPGWVPADEAFYKSFSQNSAYLGSDNVNENANSSKQEKEVPMESSPVANPVPSSNGAKLVFVMPRFFTSGLFANNVFYNGLHSLSGLPFGLCNEKTTSESHSRKMFMEDPETSNSD